jgi:hypothetical protein
MSKVQGQASRGAAITPDSSRDLEYVASGVYVTGAGNLVVTLSNMDAGTYLTIASGAAQYHPLEVKRIWSTSTATGIIALYP